MHGFKILKEEERDLFTFIEAKRNDVLFIAGKYSYLSDEVTMNSID